MRTTCWDRCDATAAYRIEPGARLASATGMGIAPHGILLFSVGVRALRAAGAIMSSSLMIASASASVRLPVKYHHQERELSCEAAALTMVLRYYGVPVTEAEVI